MVQIYGTFYLELILLSGLVMIIASYFMMDVVLRSKKNVQNIWGNMWVLFGSLIFGLGVWSMHFIGMLAYSLPLPAEYDWVLSILSLLIIAFTSWGAFYISSKRRNTLLYPSCSSVLMATGVIWMHFTGMKSLEFQGSMEYQFSFVFLSSAVALCSAGVIFFSLFCRRFNPYIIQKYKWAIAIMVGLGMSSVHYINIMGTSYFVSRNTISSPPAENGQGPFITHSVTISVITLLLIILFLAYFDKYKALQDSVVKDQQYLALYYNSPNFLCTITEEGIIYNANTSFIEKTGVLPGNDIMLTSLFLDSDYIHDQIKDSFQGNNAHYQAQMISRHQDVFQVDVTHIPIKVDQKVTGVTAIIKDITEIEEAKQMAEEKMYLKEAILNTISEGLFVYDTNGVTMRANNRAAELLGISNEDAYSVNPFRTDLPFVDQNGEPLPRREWPAIRVLKEHTSFKDYVLGIERFGDEIQWLSVNASPLIMHGKVAGAVVTFKDVTEFRAQALKLTRANQHLKESIKEAIQANQAKSEFLSRMSHELRTPLNSIIGYSELLMDQQYDTTVSYQKLEKIHHSGVHLLHLINEILDLSKIEKNNFEVRSEWVDVKETVESAIDIIGPMADEKNAQISFDMQEENAWEIVADSLFLRQVLVNLLSNALKYNKPNGKVTIYGEREGDSIKINIQDNGIGIKDEYIPYIFDSFYRVPNQGVSGTGIGLSIVKYLVDKMNGSYGVQSKENEGSIFWISFPVNNKENELLNV